MMVKAFHIKSNKLVSIFIIVCSLISFGCSSLKWRDHHQGPTAIAPVKTKKVVFIHGMFMTPKGWENWVTHFTNKGYSVTSPAWPLHDLPMAQQRDPKNWSKLGALKLEDLLQHYREHIKSLNEKPILIGHSMGGLIAQILANEGLASAAIAIHPAAPNGLLVFSWSFLRSNWAMVSPFADLDEPVWLDQDQFSYRFTNAQSPEWQREFYDKYYVPESRRVGKGATQEIAEINPENLKVPLLLISGSSDHIIPDKLVYRNFGLYKNNSGLVDYISFPGRDHSTIGSPGWEIVADVSLDWLKSLAQ